VTSIIDRPFSPSAPERSLRDLLTAANLSLCFQCQKCTAGCPVADGADVKPHEIIRLVQLGAINDVLTSRFIWECTSCGTCEARCPQAVALPAAIDSLRRLSLQRKVAAETAVPAFNEIFLGMVRQMGRTHELALMAAFKLRTRRLSQDTSKLPTMLRKRKFTLLPHIVSGRGERQRIFRRVRDRGKETP
jgi:heterodisulfide reductase subunit C2